MWETKKNKLLRRLAIIKYVEMDLFARDVQSGLKILQEQKRRY